MTPTMSIVPTPAATRAALLATYRHMLRARQIDRIESEYVRRGEAFFSVSGAGHEATAVLSDFLGEDDWLHCHYRDKALMLARGISAEMFFLCLFNKDGSHSRGRQMNAQMSAPELKILSQVCPVGNGALQAVGVASAVKDQAARPVVLCSLGDGMTQQGEVYEAIAQAVRDTLPVLFLIQHNGLALSTPTAGRTFYSTPGGDADVFCSQPIVRIDGRDPLAARAALGDVVATMRTSRRPAIVVFAVDRLDDHSSSDDQRVYRSADEIARLRATGDPLARLRDELIARDVAPGELDAFERESECELREVAEAALRAPEPSPAFTALRPLPPELTDANREYRGGQAKGVKGSDDELTMLEAIREVLRKRLRQDERVTLFGEDIDDPKGDVFGVTRGLAREFPQRVANSPLAEATIVGMAIGQALAGKRPVAFLQFADFLPLAFNQIVSELATLHWRSDGGWPAPVIVMVPCGGYRPGLGPFHSASMDGVAAHIPGIDVFMPSTAGDAAGMLNAAFASERPTIFFYPKACLNERSVTTTPDVARQFVPLGRARLCRAGDDLTLVGWGNTVRLCLQAADALALAGVAAEVIDLRCLAPLDIASVLASATRTGRLLIAHEDIQTAGVGAEVVARVAESAKRPIVVRRVARADTHVPCNFANQLDVLPSFRKILDTAVAMLGGEVAWQDDAADRDGLRTIKAIGLSPSDETVNLVEWQVKPGDRLRVGQIVATLEAEKTTFDFVSPLAGEVVELRCALGQRVAIGEPLLALRCADDAPDRLPVTREAPGVPVISGIGKDAPAANDDTAIGPAGDGRVAIAAIATAVGSRRVGNDEIAALCAEWTADEILKRIGIETRYWVGDDEDALTLALAACRKLFAETSLTVGDIDLIVCATGTPLYASPSLAALLQHELAAGCETGTATYDVSAACTGYLTGLQIAYDYLRSRPTQRVLLVTSETLSRKLDRRSRDTAPLFGDAASATLLVGAPSTAIPVAYLHRPLLSGRGEPAQALTSPTARDGFITMDGLKVYESAVRKMPEILHRACAEAAIAVGELALVVPHQANQRIIDAIRVRMKLGHERIYSNFRNYGNTSSSSIPLCLAETLAARAPGERIGLTAFGGGFTWGAAIIETLGGSTQRAPTRT